MFNIFSFFYHFQRVDCPLNFTSLVEVDLIRSGFVKLAANMRINGIQMENMEDNGVSKGSFGEIYGRKTFDGNIVVRDDLRVKSRSFIFVDNMFMNYDPTLKHSKIERTL